MNDDELKHLFHQAHAGERPPSVAAILDRRRRRLLPALGIALVALGVILAFWLRPRALPEVPTLLADSRVEVWAPLDFLLQPPGADLLGTTPAFDTRGWAP